MHVTDGVQRAVVQQLAPETVAGLSEPKRSVEIGWPAVAIERPDGGYDSRDFHLRTSPIEAALLALDIQDAVDPKAMAAARRLRTYGDLGPNTGFLERIRDGIERIPNSGPLHGSTGAEEAGIQECA